MNFIILRSPKRKTKKNGMRKAHLKLTIKT